ncbi:GNAT family N-acetyltransferase [Planifilum fimeticola]|uniref:GNAT family N-acetyltransferase n=1 Tax=Planifilum fimeticola TaxID=201975 RepID=UPI001B80493B
MEKEGDGEKVATFTAWWGYTGKRHHPFVRWVAVKEPHQGMGLGKAIIAEGVRRMVEIEGVAPCISRRIRGAIKPSDYTDGPGLTLRLPNPCRGIKRRWRCL